MSEGEQAEPGVHGVPRRSLGTRGWVPDPRLREGRRSGMTCTGAFCRNCAELVRGLRTGEETGRAWRAVRHEAEPRDEVE